MKNCYDSVYAARVVDNHDPMRSGRVRLEVPSVLGTGRSSWSPWAPSLLPPGQFASYDEGDLVMVMFREGNPRYPVVLGRVAPYNGQHEGDEYSAWSLDSYGPQSRDAKDHATDPWDNLDHKKSPGHSHPPFWNPIVKGFFSKLGAKLFWSEQPHDQKVELRDRLGQVVRLVGDPANPADPVDETRRGGTYTAPGLDNESEVYKATGFRGLLQLLGLHGQKLEMRVKDIVQQEELELLNQDPSGQHGARLYMSNSLLNFLAKLTRWIPGREQALEMVLHPVVAAQRYQRLKDWLGQEVEIFSDEDSPNQVISIRSGSGELIEVRKNKEGLLGIYITDRQGNEVHLDALLDSLTVKHHAGQKIEMFTDGTLTVSGASGADSLTCPPTGGWAFTTAVGVTVNGKKVAVNGDLDSNGDAIIATGV